VRDPLSRRPSPADPPADGIRWHGSSPDDPPLVYGCRRTRPYQPPLPTPTPAQYTNGPDGGTQRSDLATCRANDGTFPAPTDPATRRFIVEVLWQAYSAQFGTDRVP